MSTQNSIHGEIREQQQKTKDMSLKGKLGYFWDYYKIHTLVAIVAVVCVVIFIKEYRDNKDYALYAILINIDPLYIGDNPWEDEFAEYADIDTSEYHSYVDTSIMLSNDDYSQYSIAGTEKLIIMSQTGTMDVLVANTEQFEGLAQNELFADMETILPEEVMKKYQDCLYYTDAATFSSDDDSYPVDDSADLDDAVINHRDPSTMEQPIPVGICLSDGNKIIETGCYDYLNGTTYQGYPSEIILGIPINSTRTDMVLKFLEFLDE